MAEKAKVEKPVAAGMPGFTFPEFAEVGKKSIEAMLDMESGFFATIDELNKHWLARAKSQAELASELIAKLSEVRSIPDAASACQDCAGRQMEMFAEDSRRIFAAGQKVMERFLHNGGALGGST
jgi:hypothetical protein